MSDDGSFAYSVSVSHYPIFHCRLDCRGSLNTNVRASSGVCDRTLSLGCGPRAASLRRIRSDDGVAAVSRKPYPPRLVVYRAACIKHCFCFMSQAGCFCEAEKRMRHRIENGKAGEVCDITKEVASTRYQRCPTHVPLARSICHSSGPAAQLHASTRR